MNASLINHTPAAHPSDVLAAERKALYARASAGLAELLMRDQALTRVEYERRLRAMQQADEELRQLRARRRDAAPAH